MTCSRTRQGSGSSLCATCPQVAVELLRGDCAVKRRGLLLAARGHTSQSPRGAAGGQCDSCVLQYQLAGAGQPGATTSLLRSTHQGVAGEVGPLAPRGRGAIAPASSSASESDSVHCELEVQRQCMQTGSSQQPRKSPSHARDAGWQRVASHGTVVERGLHPGKFRR